MKILTSYISSANTDQRHSDGVPEYMKHLTPYIKIICNIWKFWYSICHQPVLTKDAVMGYLSTWINLSHPISKYYNIWKFWHPTYHQPIRTNNAVMGCLSTWKILHPTSKYYNIWNYITLHIISECGPKTQSWGAWVHENSYTLRCNIITYENSDTLLHIISEYGPKTQWWGAWVHASGRLWWVCRHIR